MKQLWLWDSLNQAKRSNIIAFASSAARKITLNRTWIGTSGIIENGIKHFTGRIFLKPFKLLKLMSIH